MQKNFGASIISVRKRLSKMKKGKKILIVILGALFLTGCSHIANRAGYQKVEVAQAQIERLKVESVRALAAKEAEIKQGLSQVIDNQGIQIQNAANSLWGAKLTRPLYTEETRVMLITFNRIDEAMAALGVGPTLEAMRVEQERLVKELDEKQTSLAELQRAHNDVVKEKEGLVAETALSKEQVILLEAEKIRIQKEYDDNIILAQGELSKLQDKLLDAEGIAKARHEAIEKNKRLAMSVLGVLSIVGLFIGLYLPLLKKQAFTFSAITGAGAILIIFMQPSHFAVLFTIAIILGLYFLFRKVGVISQSAANSFNAIQEFKEKEPEKYKALKPILVEYNKKYTKNGKTEDERVTGYVEEVLRDYEKI
jgi:hypothetical protein